MIWIIGHLLAIGIGISLGLIGGGGSVLAVPILVYIMGISPKSAIAMTLFIIGFVSLIGVIPHWKRGHVNIKITCIFGSATMLGAFIGAKLAILPFITGTMQMILFAVMMLLAAIFMINKNSQVATDNTENQLDLSTYPQPICKFCWLWMMTEGLGVGILTGLVGVGGGFAIVPALVILGNIPIKEAIGTSLIIIALNSAAALSGYLGHVNLDWNLIISFTLAAGFGIIIGSYLSEFVQPRRLQQIFSFFLIAVAGFVLFQNRGKFYSSHSAVRTNLDYQSKIAVFPKPGKTYFIYDK
jgi:uncharacterized protein